MCVIKMKMKCRTHGQTHLKLVEGSLDVTTETKTPNLEHDLQVKENGEEDLIVVRIIIKNNKDL